MEFSSFFFHLFFYSLLFQLSNTIVSYAKVQIPAQNASTDKLDSLTEQMDKKDADIGKRLMQQRIKRDTDRVYIDHRQSGCFDEPRSQGDCSASYAFATIAFYEWLNCQRNKEFQAFSEQYIIDCGYRHQNEGCDSGNPVKAIAFVKDCGLVFREIYPYTGRQRRCPFKDSFRYADMGSLHIDESIAEYVPLHQLARYLEYGPIIVIIEAGHGFLSYRGGIDDNVGHSPDNMHAMLLIGHGRENGVDYWLFRNSHFDPSINDGHYKLNKNVDCLKGGYGIGLSGSLMG